MNLSVIKEVLAESAQAIRDVTAQRDELLSKVASYERRNESEKVARIIVDKGLTDEPVETLAKSLEKMAEQGKLTGVKDGLEYFARNMGKFATVQDDGVSQSVGNSTDLERYLTGLLG